MRKTRLAIAGALAVGGLYALSPQAQASSDCASGSTDPVSAGAFGGGGQVCVQTGRVNATLTGTPGYVIVDGAAGNPEPADGYIGVDGSGPVGCASGDYSPGGGNPIVDPADPEPGGDCMPQTLGY